jgi:hypothetical protein
MRIVIALEFVKGYIGHPYTPEREKLINIQKQSGLNRARSEDKRAKTLKAFLTAHNITVEEYQALEIAAARPFYMGPDGEILIPAHQLHGMMGQAADVSPASIRLAQPEQIRILLEWENLRTGKHKPDGIWERFVPVKSGTGQILSNQRSLRADPYIENFRASGALRLANPDQLAKAHEFIKWAGAEIGVGAARKMGWGRFEVAQWQPMKK